MVVQFARVLTQAEKLALVANPWQLFAPAPRTLAVDFATVQARTFAPLKLRGAPRAAQAQQPARVNWGHPLAQGLRAVQSGPVVELVNGIAYRLPQSVVTPTREGVAFAYPNNTSPAGVSPAYPGDDGTRCTLELLHRWTSVDTGDREFMSFGANSGQQVRGIFARGASRTIVLGNFNADIDSGIPFAQDGSLQHIFITFGSAAPSLFYVNGRLAFTGASSAVLASALQTFAVPGARGIFPAPDAKIIKSAYYNRVLSASEISALTANPWQVYSSSQLTLGVEFAGTITRPASDIVVAGWTATPGPSFYSAIDDATADDTDFVTSPDVNAATPLVNGLSQTVPAGRYDIRIRARRTAAAGQIRIVLLDSSNSPVGTSAWQALTASFAPYTLSITTTGTADRVRHEVQP
ncbi:MAG: LamG-like jellyroll fold domain-containing protein [Leptothrix sp. (in: b-proteobacteria)]